MDGPRPITLTFGALPPGKARWLGYLAAFPVSPIVGDALVLSTTNTEYVWDGVQWIAVTATSSGTATKGEVGATGPTGPPGTATATGGTGAPGSPGGTGGTGGTGGVGASGGTGGVGASGGTGGTGGVGASGGTGGTGDVGATGPAGGTGGTGGVGGSGGTGGTGGTGGVGATGPDASTRAIMLCEAFTPVLTGADVGEVTIPFASDGTSILTWRVVRITLRVQTAGGAPVVVVEKSTASGAFSAATVGTLTMGSGNYEVSTTAALGTVDSGNKIRFNVTTLATAQSWTILVEITYP